jgi:CBS domain-containing protein
MARTVQEIMNHELLAIRPDSAGREARDLLRSFSVGAAPVVDEAGRPLGVLSLGDLLDPEGTAAERMTRPAMCVGSSLTVEDAARRLASTEMHHLVVVDTTGVAVGMVSTLDLLRALLGIPTRHPAAFPHWDDTTEASWTDDWPLEEESAAHAPSGPGVLALSTSHLGEPNAVVWVEPCANLRARVLELASHPDDHEPALARALALHGLRFRATSVCEEAPRTRIVTLLRDRLDHLPPPGAT